MRDCSAPSIVILEDVDLIAEERANNRCPTVLHELMDEMDGVGAQTDCIFLLTTNRPEILEPAWRRDPAESIRQSNFRCLTKNAAVASSICMDRASTSVGWILIAGLSKQMV